MRLFFDVNVVLDVLTDRQPWSVDSAAALSLVDLPDTDGFIAAHTVTTLHHLAFRHLAREAANAAVLELLSLFEIAAVDESTLLKALSIDSPDFEDAVQAACALQSGADCIITRVSGGYGGAGLPVVTPAQLVARVRSAESSKTQLIDDRNR